MYRIIKATVLQHQTLPPCGWWCLGLHSIPLPLVAALLRDITSISCQRSLDSASSKYCLEAAIKFAGANSVEPHQSVSIVIPQAETNPALGGGGRDFSSFTS
jgi:hypothetical protein